MELIQDITQRLPRKDQLSLSLVSKRLNEFTKKDVFSSIYMNNQEAVDRWGDLPQDFRAGIMRHCSSLFCKIDTFMVISGHEHSDKYPIFFAKYLNNFNQLKSLHLTEVSLVNPKFIKDSQPRIKELTLDTCYSTLEAFATLVNKFPNLTHLKLIKIHDCPGAGVFPSHLSELFPKTLRKLSIADFLGYNPFLNFIFSVPWDEVSILEGTDFDRLEPQPPIDGASANLKRLDMQDDQRCRTYRDLPAIVPWEC